MSQIIYFYVIFLLINIGKSFCNADHILTAETSFSIFTPWTNPNAVNTVFLELPRDQKRAVNSDGFLSSEDQIMIRVRIGPSHNVGPIEKYLVVNDIYDPKRQVKDRALVPYVIEISRGEPVITYSLEYLEDVKFNNYKQRSLHTSKKTSEQASPIQSKDSYRKEYKPAVDRLNTVMKKLSDLFENEAKKDELATEAEDDGKDKDSETDASKTSDKDTNREKQKTSFYPKDYNKLELQIGNVESSIPKSISIRIPKNDKHNGHRLESSCLKRHAFENWKRDSKNFEDNKQLPLGLSSEQLPINQKATLSKKPFSLNQQFNQQSETSSDWRDMFDKAGNDDFGQPEQDTAGLQSNNRLKRFFPSLQDEKSKIFSHDNLNKEQTPNDISASMFQNMKEAELLRILRGLQPRNSRRPASHFPENENFASTANNDGTNYESPMKNQGNLRIKRSLAESDSQQYLKIDENNDRDQCNTNEAFENNDFDFQACDTCGGKSKKTQKPPHFMNTRQAQNRIQLSGNKPIQRNDMMKRETCHCRTLHTPCICCPGKKFRSFSNPVWFSAFALNSPTAFVTSRVRIFRKRRGIWWEVAPPTNLNSMTGVYSDGNYSFSFSSPIELFQLEKALRLQDQQLLFPALHKEEPNEENKIEISPEAVEAEIINSKELKNNPSLVMTMNKKSVNKKKSVPELHPLTDFGFFPKTINAIDKCPYNDRSLCLNMLTDEAPASTFKVQMPFQDNVLVNKNMIRIQISNIITDATTKDAMQISVLMINKGCKNRLVTLAITKCPTDSSLTEAKTCVQKLLLPNIAETATFLLPLIQPANAKHKRYECQVEVSTKMTSARVDRVSRNVHANDMKVVSKRKFLIEPEKRCLCIWYCACHCIPKLVPHDAYKMCRRMSASELRQAGFPKDLSGQDTMDGMCSSSAVNTVYKFIILAICLLLLMLSLGFIKAFFGLMIVAIDRCCFDYVYVNPSYVCSSRCRRFCGNVFIFVIFPFRFLCKCFTPTPEDLLVASSEWQCCQQQGSMCENEYDDDYLSTNRKSKYKSTGSSKHRLSSGIEAKQQELSKRLSRLSLAFQQEFSDEECSPTKVPRSASDIIRTLSEKRDQRRRTRQNVETASTTAATRTRLANELVQSLLNVKRVYRTLKEPIGNVSKIPHGIKYCIQGYFIATIDVGFEFVSFQPLVQYRGISSETFFTKELHPPIFLNSSAFNRRFSNEMAVLKSGEITVHPPEGVPCINVRAVNDGMGTETSSPISKPRGINRREQRSSSNRLQR